MKNRTLADAKADKDHLVELAIKLGVTQIALEFLDHPDVLLYSGCAFSLGHHYGDHGLILHVREVVDIALVNRKLLGLNDIDEIELYLSCLYHDFGKLYDYERHVENGVVNWRGLPHKRNIHHISRSAIEWSKRIERYPTFKTKYHDSVLHNILAHHGSREAGSPVAPNGKCAWLVHLSDSISARMDDASQLDLLTKTKIKK